MSREGQRGRRRSNFAVARNRLSPFNRDSLVRNWTQPTGLVPFQETTDPFWGGNGAGYNATGNTSTNTPAMLLPPGSGAAHRTTSSRTFAQPFLNRGACA